MEYISYEVMEETEEEIYVHVYDRLNDAKAKQDELGAGATLFKVTSTYEEL